MASKTSDLECVICTEALVDPRALRCGHSYCGPPRPCLNTLDNLAGGLTCAVCRENHTNIKPNDLKPLYGIRDYFTDKPPTEKRYPHLPCEKHPSKECKLWCNSCEVMICRKCFDCGHDSHSVRKLKNYLMERIEDDYGVRCEFAFEDCGSNALSLISSREAELETLKSAVQVVSEELRLAKLQKSIVDEYYDFCDDSSRRYKDEQLETALFSKLVNLPSLGLPGVGNFQPRDFEISVKKKPELFESPKPQPFGFSNRNGFDRLKEPDIVPRKVLDSSSSIWPIFLAIPIRVARRKLLQFKACDPCIERYPIQFLFEPESGKKRDKKYLRMIATCQRSADFFDRMDEFLPCGMNYTFRVKNLFNKKKDFVTTGIWKNPMSIELRFETLELRDLAYLRNGWIVKRDGEEYIDVSLSLTKRR